jgi:hypothetical protein
MLAGPGEKSQYDAQLRKKLEASKPQPVPELKREVPKLPEPTQLPQPPSRMPPRLPGARAKVRPIGKQEDAGVPAPSGNTLKLVVLGGGAAAGLLVVVSLALYFVWRGTGNGPGKSPPVSVAGRSSSGPSEVKPEPVKVEPHARPPRLAKVLDQTAEEGQLLEVKAVVADRGTASGQLLFGLVQGPQGAAVDAETGVFRWTPASGQAGVKHVVTLRVAARDASELAGQGTFTISVREPKLLPPRFEAIPEVRVEAGDEKPFDVSASDPNRPPRKLEYTLRDAPAWVHIDARSGSGTVAPPKDDQGGPYRMWVRVTSDAPDSLYVERLLAVVVTARAKSSEDKKGMPEVPASGDLSGLTEIKGLSGPLNPAEMDVRQAAMGAAQNLVERADNDPKVMPLFAGTLGGPVAAVCELNRANRLDGALVSFVPGKDPLSCLDAKTRSIQANMPKTTTRRSTLPGVTPGTAPGMSTPAQGAVPGGQAGGMAGFPADDSGMNVNPGGMGFAGSAGTSFASAQAQALQTFWADVRLWAYFQFKAGSRHGVAALWDQDGQKVFWGNYQRGKRDDFCCLFKDNLPRIVVVFEQGEKRSVYLISKNRVQKTFASGEEAQDDPIAGPLLSELEGVEKLFTQGEQNSEKQIKATLNFRAGNSRQFKNFMAQMRMAGRAASQIQGMQGSQRKALGGP